MDIDQVKFGMVHTADGWRLTIELPDGSHSESLTVYATEREAVFAIVEERRHVEQILGELS